MRNSITIFILLFTTSLCASQLDRDSLAAMAKNGHTPLEYKVVKKIIFSTVESREGVICSVYTPTQCKNFYYRDPADLNLNLNKETQNFKLNIEHTWPQSKGAKEMPANSDMHHLFITSKESNSKRANLPFCKTVYDFWQKDGSIKGIDQYAQDCFEPQDLHKGNVARAIFYFSIRYNFPIDSEQEATLRKWHLSDPVDDREIERNEIIKALQGNSNPFITNPEGVAAVADF